MSGLPGNWHGPFLGEGAAATPPPYPTTLSLPSLSFSPVSLSPSLLVSLFEKRVDLGSFRPSRPGRQRVTSPTSRGVRPARLAPLGSRSRPDAARPHPSAQAGRETAPARLMHLLRSTPSGAQPQVPPQAPLGVFGPWSAGNCPRRPPPSTHTPPAPPFRAGLPFPVVPSGRPWPPDLV